MSQPGSQLVDALVLAQGNHYARDNPWSMRRDLYAPVLSNARSVMITKMARPEVRTQPPARARAPYGSTGVLKQPSADSWVAHCALCRRC
jgi:hypothetical protein